MFEVTLRVNHRGKVLHLKRIAAGKLGYKVAAAADIHSSRLTDIEHGRAEPSDELYARIERAIEQV